MKILKRLILEHIQNEKDKWKLKTPPTSVEQIGTKEYPISISMIPNLLRCEKMAIGKIMEKYDTEKEMSEKIANGCGIDACIFLQKSGHFPNSEERVKVVGELFPAMDKKFVADLAKNIEESGIVDEIDDCSIPVEFEIDNVHFSGTCDYRIADEAIDGKCSGYGGKELVYNYLGQLAGYAVGMNCRAGGILRTTDFRTLKRGDWREKSWWYRVNDIIPELLDGWEERLIGKLARRIREIQTGVALCTSISCYPCSYCQIGIERCIRG